MPRSGAKKEDVVDTYALGEDEQDEEEIDELASGDATPAATVDGSERTSTSTHEAHHITPQDAAAAEQVLALQAASHPVISADGIVGNVYQHQQHPAGQHVFFMPPGMHPQQYTPQFHPQQAHDPTSYPYLQYPGQLPPHLQIPAHQMPAAHMTQQSSKKKLPAAKKKPTAELDGDLLSPKVDSFKSAPKTKWQRIDVTKLAAAVDDLRSKVAREPKEYDNVEARKQRVQEVLSELKRKKTVDAVLSHWK